MTTAILHCHLFKNAGTSLDSILSRNFPGKWIEKEFKGTPKLRRPKIASWINDNPQCIAFSSHTCVGPLDQNLNRELLLITNYRHPIDRLKSAYGFEKNQGTSNFGAVLASETNFCGYIRSRLALAKIVPHFFCVNWQARYFATFSTDAIIRPDISDDELYGLALEGFDKFAHIGLVNKMDESNKLLEKNLRRIFPHFNSYDLHLNRSEQKRSLTEKLDSIQHELGEEVFTDLLRANEVDLKLYDQLEKYISDTS